MATMIVGGKRYKRTGDKKTKMAVAEFILFYCFSLLISIIYFVLEFSFFGLKFISLRFCFYSLHKTKNSGCYECYRFFIANYGLNWKDCRWNKNTIGHGTLSFFSILYIIVSFSLYSFLKFSFFSLTFSIFFPRIFTYSASSVHVHTGLQNREFASTCNKQTHFMKYLWKHVIYKALCFGVAQGRMNGAPNETRTHSCRSASLAC